MSGNHQIIAGFMPLLDSAVVVAAKEKGFAEAEGVDLTLVRETSWANIRDRLAVGHFQVAHMLAPMPIACNLGLTPLAVPTIVPMALGLGGNAITVSNALWSEMADHGAKPDFDPATTGRALKRVLTQRAEKSSPVVRFAVVHPHSGHNYELRYWLAASGIDPARDVEIVIVPPPLMPDALASGTIDGYCVGEPWNTAAAMLGQGHIVTVKAAIWRSSPEKVLGVGAAWARDNPDALSALLRALCKSAEWCGDATNHEDLARSSPTKPISDARPRGCCRDFPETCTRARATSGSPRTSSFPSPRPQPSLGRATHFGSIRRWCAGGKLSIARRMRSIARETYRPDLYRAALKPLGVALPVANAKVEGALQAPTPVGSAGASLVLGPDGFFDGGLFDPDQLDSYIASQKR